MKTGEKVPAKKEGEEEYVRVPVKIGDTVKTPKGTGRFESVHEGMLNIRLENSELVTVPLDDCTYVVAKKEQAVELTAVQKAEQEEQQKHEAALAKEREDIKKANEEKEKAAAKPQEKKEEKKEPDKK